MESLRTQLDPIPAGAQPSLVVQLRDDGPGGAAPRSENQPPLGLAVADHSDIIRHGLRRMLSDQQDVVIRWESATAEDTAFMIRSSPPNVLIVSRSLAVVLESEAMTLTLKARMGVVVLTGDRASRLRALPPIHAIELTRSAGREELSRTIRSAFQSAAVADRVPAHVAEVGSDAARERYVLAMIASGSTNRQIAHNLGVSEDAVKTYLKALYARWHVHSRAEAGVKAIRLGVIT